MVVANYIGYAGLGTMTDAYSPMLTVSCLRPTSSMDAENLSEMGLQW